MTETHGGPHGPSTDELRRLLEVLDGADSVELKLTVPDGDQRSAVVALEMDPLDADLRQVYFLDTPDLLLEGHGVIARARRTRGGDDSVVKLRPVVPSEPADSLRRLPGFAVEVDAMPGGFVCSARLKADLRVGKVKDVTSGKRPPGRCSPSSSARSSPTRSPRTWTSTHSPCWARSRSSSSSSSPRLRPAIVAELWFYPDGSRILELSTKCDPGEAFDVAARTRVFLESRGIDLTGQQQTKTRTALAFFATGSAEA